MRGAASTQLTVSSQSIRERQMTDDVFLACCIRAPNRVGGAEFYFREKKKKKWKTIDQNSVVQMEIAKKLRIFSFAPSA
jgi:hypothetical protein